MAKAKKAAAKVASLPEANIFRHVPFEAAAEIKRISCNLRALARESSCVCDLVAQTLSSEA